MGTRKKFTPEELKHLRANPYTLRVTPDSISYTLAFKEAFWALSLQGYTGPAAFRKLGYNTEVLGFERVHNTTKRIRRQPSHRRGFASVPGEACASQEAQGLQHQRMSRQAHEAGDPVLQQQMAFLKKS